MLVTLEGIWSKEFQDDGTLELGVLALIDNTHAALTQLGENAVVGDRLADHTAPLTGSRRRV